MGPSVQSTTGKKVAVGGPALGRPFWPWLGPRDSGPGVQDGPGDSCTWSGCSPQPALGAVTVNSLHCMIHRHTDTHRHIHRHTDTHRHRHTQTHTQTHTHTHVHAHTHTHTHTVTHTTHHTHLVTVTCQKVILHAKTPKK